MKISKKPTHIKIGDIVDYHSIIGGPATKIGMKVTVGPELLGGHTWVVWLNGHSGCVAVDACTLRTKDMFGGA